MYNNACWKIDIQEGGKLYVDQSQSSVCSESTYQGTIQSEYSSINGNEVVWTNTGTTYPLFGMLEFYESGSVVDSVILVDFVINSSMFYSKVILPSCDLIRT